MNNKCFKKVSKEKEKEINILFPNIKNLITDYDDIGFNYLGITVFDHWLNRDEANKELGEDEPQYLKKDRNNKLYKFNIDINRNFELYYVRIRGRQKDNIVYRHINYDKCLSPGIHGYGWGHMSIFVLPKLKAVYFEGYDYTYHLYYQDKKLLDKFLSKAKENNLFALE